MVTGRIAFRLEKPESEIFGILDELPVETVVCTEDYSILYANSAFIRSFWHADHPIAEQKLNCLLAQKLPKTSKMDLPLTKGSYERNLVKINGVKYWGLITFAPSHFLEGGRNWILQITDITELKIEQSKLAYQESIWRNAIKASNHGVWDYFAPTQSHCYSAEWKAMRGFDPDHDRDFSHEEWEARVHPDDIANVRATIEAQGRGEFDTFSYEYRERHANGHYIWISSRGQVLERDINGQTMRAIGTDFDITALKTEEETRSRQIAQEHRQHLEELNIAHRETKKAHQRAALISLLDPLTDLPNRRAFNEKLNELLSVEQPEDHRFGLLILDLDRFKPVNDTHGHAVGDKVICKAAQRLRASIGISGLAARLGGDEFGVLIPVDKPDDIGDRLRKIAEGISAAICEPVEIGDLKIEIGASIGIACYPEHGQSSATLMRHADLALYNVKQQQRGGSIVFAKEMEQLRAEKNKLETCVRLAVRNKEFVPHFQPIIDLNSMTISGFEVLSRWNHPELGCVPPDKFMPIITQFGLVAAFASENLARACEIFRDWPEPLKMSFNVTGATISDRGLAGRILRILDEFRFPPERLELEISESAFVHDNDATNDVFTSLQKVGIQIALDDFGVGYSGLKYLQRLKFNGLKLDRSYIMALTSNIETRKIVESVISIAEKFNLQTVAEGIEDAETLALVREMGYRFGQGFYFAKALSAQDAVKFISDWDKTRTSLKLESFG